MQWEDAQIQCPYCQESLWISIDPGGGNKQRYVEDCQVCCRPILINAVLDDEDEWNVEASAE